MFSFIRHHIVYSIIGFAFVIVAGIGFFIYQKYTLLQSAQTGAPVSANPTPAEAEIAFSLDSPEDLCTTFTASPQQAAAPATIIFTAQLSGTQGDSLLLNLDFGDGENQSVERLVTSTNGVETQNISHTYTNAGNFNAILSITNGTNQSDPVSCSTPVAISGILEQEESKVTPTILLPATGGTEEDLVPTLQPTIAPSPTKIPTPTQTARFSPTPTIEEDETIPVPKVPEAGGVLPTALMAAGGLLIIALVFAL